MQLFGQLCCAVWFSLVSLVGVGSMHRIKAKNTQVTGLQFLTALVPLSHLCAAPNSSAVNGDNEGHPGVKTNGDNTEVLT